VLSCRIKVLLLRQCTGLYFSQRSIFWGLRFSNENELCYWLLPPEIFINLSCVSTSTLGSPGERLTPGGWRPTDGNYAHWKKTIILARDSAIILYMSFSDSCNPLRVKVPCVGKIILLQYPQANILMNGHSLIT
jgi:hypothetical protein